MAMSPNGRFLALVHPNTLTVLLRETLEPLSTIPLRGAIISSLNWCGSDAVVALTSSGVRVYGPSGDSFQLSLATTSHQALAMSTTPDGLFLVTPVDFRYLSKVPGRPFL